MLTVSDHQVPGGRNSPSTAPILCSHSSKVRALTGTRALEAGGRLAHFYLGLDPSTDMYKITFSCLSSVSIRFPV